MAHIPYTYVPISSAKKKSAKYALPSGGEILSDNDTTIEAGKCASAINLDILSDRVKTRNIMSAIEENLQISGTLNGVFSESYYDNLIFHSGNCLYRFDTDTSSVILITDTLPDAKSLMCNFMSKIYIYCNTHVYVLDNEFGFKEEEDMYAPLIYRNAYTGTPMYAERTNEKFNLVAPKIAVQYNTSTSSVFTVPHAIDTTRKVTAYVNNELCTPEQVKAYEDRVELVGLSAMIREKSVRLEYFLLEPEEAGFEDFIGKCRFAMAFGGNAAGGTRVFFTGNSSKKGYYYKSELQNPLHVIEDNFEIIGDGSEDITALKKMYGNLIIFTENSVYRMSYNFTQDDIYFSVKELTSEVGCDCPDSVQLIDNRVVFANSKRGIFIVDSTEETGEHNIKPISGNILEGKNTGLLDNDKKLLISSHSVDYNRKYMLFVGTRAYIWDYDATPFWDSGNYSAAQNRLRWYIYEDIDAGFVANIGGVLVSLNESDGVRIRTFLRGDGSEKISSVIQSGVSECFNPLVRKHVTNMSIKLTRYGNCKITLCLYGDCEKYYEIVLADAQKNKEKIKLNLPKKALYGFGFSLHAEGSYELEEIVVEYIEISE